MIDLLRKLLRKLVHSDVTVGQVHAEPDVSGTASSVDQAYVKAQSTDLKDGATPAMEDQDLRDALVAFDENLLDKARTQWQFGDWETLAAISREEIQHHPDKAKLALLVAVGNQQLGRASSANEFIRLAARWGCDKTLLAKILLAGVHRNLGQALVMSKSDEPSRLRAMQHFTYATSLGAVSSGVKAPDLSSEYLQKAQKKLDSGLNSGQVTVLAGKTNQSLHVSVAVRDLVKDCLFDEDVHKQVERIHAHRLGNFSLNDQFLFFVTLANGISSQRSDKMTATSYLQYARRKFPDLSPANATAMVEGFIAFGQVKVAVEVLTELSLKGIGPINLSAQSQALIQKTSTQLHDQVGKASEHGHDLLLGYLNKHLSQYKASISPRTPLLIEIGTTREDVPGQGSTKKIAHFCVAQGVDFVTVDMDPHNTKVAQELFETMGAKNCRAVTMKGEDFLRQSEGPFDFVFLDAYDFDHGKHSELRQGRYEKFLGSRIDELQCHQMHLDCAESVHQKLTDLGVVCVDDTWQEEGKWTAKGTLAMPYLLENGFEVLEARNRAAILHRLKTADVAH